MTRAVPWMCVAALALAANARTEDRAAGSLLTIPQHSRHSDPWEPPSARVSADGLHVAFASYARLSPDDTNQLPNVYVLDLTTGRVTLEAVGAGGDVSREESLAPSISSDGRYVAFEAAAAGDLVQVFVRDRHRQISRLMSARIDGARGNNHSRRPAISADGQAVVFESSATDLVEGTDANGTQSDIYIVALATGRVTRVSVSTDGRQPSRGQSVTPVVSADTRVVAFTSYADLTSQKRDDNGVPDVYVRDLLLGTTTRVSVSARGGDANGSSSYPSISADGRFIAFASDASNLAPDDRNKRTDVYLRDMVAERTELVSRRPDGRSASGASRHPAVSADASRIAFQSLAPDLQCYRRCRSEEEDINLVDDVFVLDRRTGAMARAGSSDRWMQSTRGPSLDHSGRTLVFSSRHPIAAEDRAHDEDLFIWSPITMPRR